jgi:hypothetical protein
MLKHGALLVAFFLTPALGLAQDNPTVTQITEFVKKKMDADVKPTVLKNKDVKWATPDGHFDIIYRPGDHTIIFDYPFAKLKAGAEKANEWNRDHATLSHAVIEKNTNLVVLEAVISTRGGATEGYIGRFYDQLQKERLKFVDFCAK